MSNRTSRRVAAGLGLTTVLAGAAFGAGPAMAVTHSTCTYDKNSKSVVVNDYSGADRLRLFTDHGVIAVEDGFTVTTLCREPGVGTQIARVTTTDRIAIYASPANVAGGFDLDENNGRFAPGVTKETDGDSEIEITLDTTGVPAPMVQVWGTPQADVLSIGAGGRIDFSYDTDADFMPVTPPSDVWLAGGVGDDEIDSTGLLFSSPSDVPVVLEGDAGADKLYAGPETRSLRAGAGDDHLFSANAAFDIVSGGSGDDSAYMDPGDLNAFDDVEHKSYPKL